VTLVVRICIGLQQFLVAMWLIFVVSIPDKLASRFCNLPQEFVETHERFLRVSGFRALFDVCRRRLLAFDEEMVKAFNSLSNPFLHSFTLKGRVNLLVYTSPESLRREMAESIEFYNHRRYHEGIGNVAPADIYIDRREEILQLREGQRTVLRWIEYNLGCGETQNTDEPEPETIA
jgi:hypothetical protein